LYTDIYRVWCKKGIRPIIAQQQIREYSYVVGAVCPLTGEVFPLTASYIDTEVMNIYLQQMSEYYQAYQVILFMDNAGWHRSKGLTVPANIHIEYLPPYSPELNPAEQLWKYLRGHWTCNNSVNSLDKLEDIVIEGLNYLIKNPEIAKSFSNYHWIRDAKLCN
jgi:transposase